MNNSFYFSHDYNSRNDEKILELRAEFGWDGYGIFWALIETMAESSDGKLNRGAIGGLSVGLGVDKTRLLAIVDFCIEISLFSLEEDTNRYFSNRLLSHLEKRVLFKEAGQKGAKKRWKNNTPNRGANSKGKERKEEEIKEEEIKEEEIKEEEYDARARGDTYLSSPLKVPDEVREKIKEEKLHIIEPEVYPAFHDFWSAYDYEVFMDDALKEWKSVKQDNRELIMQHVPAYVASTPNKKYRLKPADYLSKKAWRNEIVNFGEGKTRDEKINKSQQLRASVLRVMQSESNENPKHKYN